MTYRGHIKNGVAVPDTPVELPDGTAVRIELDHAESQFWHTSTVQELSRQQGVIPAQSLNDLTIDWPDDDSVDDLVAMLREVRR